MSEYRKQSHSVSRLSVHPVWVTRYRYHVLGGNIQKRCREIIIQICNSENVKILKGVAGKDHVHIHVEYPPSLSISVLVKKLKGRSFHHLQQEYPMLKKRYWGQHFFWCRLWSMEYRRHHRKDGARLS